MYTILVKSDDTLIATNKETIFHRSSNVRKLQFLVDPVIEVGNETLNLTDLVCILEYKLPISHKYTPLPLMPSEELYKGKLQYILDIDTKFTSEVGNVELQLRWVKPEMIANGTVKEYVRITGSIAVTILKVNQWDDYIPSSELSNITRMILENKAYGEQIKLYAESLITNKCECNEGVPAVDFASLSDSPTGNYETNNVVEF